MAITGRIARETSLLPMGHLTCVGHTREELSSDRGRPTARPASATSWPCAATRASGPSAPWTPTPGGLDLRLRAGRAGPRRAAASASASRRSPRATRAAESREPTRGVLVAKADAGAEFAVTQMFFRASDYFGLVERVRRASASDIPILPGIMPIHEPQLDPPDGASCPGAELPETRRPVRGLEDDPAACAPRAIRDRDRALRGAARRRARRACTSTR